MKKSWFAVLLAVLCCLTVWVVPAAAADAADELDRAAALGIVTGQPTAEPVTARKFFAMLDVVVERTNADVLPTFQTRYPAARASDVPLNRYDGMVAALAAAEVLGADSLNVDTWYALHQQIGETCWDTIFWNGDLFGPDGWSEPALDWNRDAAAYFYSFGRRSSYSGRTLFDYDPETNSMRTDAPLTETEAVLAALRLHDSIDSNFMVTDRVIGAAEQALLNAAESRVQAILQSETDVTFPGQAYYVSNDGDDTNDGKTPETAWATLERVNNAWLQPGDAVLFERGGMWRGHLYGWKGVTYSAYGTGEKPRIYGSPESGVGAEKWNLWYEKDGVKIWNYHTTLQDPGGIVFNDGDAMALRVYSYWNGTSAVFWDSPDREFDIVEALEKDLQFYCGYPADLADRKIPFPAFDNDMHGQIYLRCDTGNPGALYECIEFQCPDQAIGYCGIFQCCEDDVVVDNLCLMYSNTMGIASGGNNGITVQNCEVGFVGGGSHIIGYLDYVPVSGEGIRLDGYGNTARNNYVHNCFDGGIILEPDLQFELDNGDISGEMIAKPWGEILIEHNVIARCNSGVMIGVHCEDDAIPWVEAVTIRDNDILYAGYGWSGNADYDFTWGTADYVGNAITFWDDDYAHGTYLVEHNRLFLGKAALVHMRLTGDNAPVFTGNTYVQNRNGWLIDAGNGRQTRMLSAAQALDFCVGVLEDQTAVVPPFAAAIQQVRREGGSIFVSAESGEPALLVAAVYDSRGSMQWVDTAAVTGSNVFHIPEAVLPDAAEVRVFLLQTDSCTPLCDCQIR